MDEYTTQRIRQEMQTENSQAFKKQVAGFAILFIVACVIFFYWRSENTIKDIRPSHQIEFEQRLTKLQQEASLSNSNEIRQERASKEMSEFLSQKTYISNWIGVVTGVEKTLFNGNGVRLRSYIPDNANGKSDADYHRVCYFLKGLSNDELANLLENDKVEFSGEIGGSDDLSFNGFVEAIFKNNIVQIEKASVNKKNTNDQEPVNVTEPNERSKIFGKEGRKQLSTPAKR